MGLAHPQRDAFKGVREFGTLSIPRRLQQESQASESVRRGRQLKIERNDTQFFPSGSDAKPDTQSLLVESFQRSEYCQGIRRLKTLPIRLGHFHGFSHPCHGGDGQVLPLRPIEPGGHAV